MFREECDTFPFKSSRGPLQPFVSNLPVPKLLTEMPERQLASLSTTAEEYEQSVWLRSEIERMGRQDVQEEQWVTTAVSTHFSAFSQSSVPNNACSYSPSEGTKLATEVAASILKNSFQTEERTCSPTAPSNTLGDSAFKLVMLRPLHVCVCSEDVLRLIKYHSAAATEVASWGFRFILSQWLQVSRQVWCCFCNGCSCKHRRQSKIQAVYFQSCIIPTIQVPLHCITASIEMQLWWAT